MEVTTDDDPLGSNYRGLFQQQDWRTRWTPGREHLRAVTTWWNPFLPVEPPPALQFPRDHPPAQMKAYREKLRAECLASGHPALADFATAWLADDPLDDVREEVQHFLDTYPGYPLPDLRPARYQPTFSPYTYVIDKEPV